jgi:hypothetical protein
MTTVIISGMTLGTSGNLTGAAVLEMEDSLGASVHFTAATLRTKMFAGGTGYTANDPLTAGAASLQAVTATSVNVGAGLTVSAGGITVSAGTSSLQAVTAIQITATGAIQTANDVAGFVVNNTATTAVLLLGTTKAWVGVGSVTDARIGAFANLSLSAGGSNSAHLTIASSGAVTIAAGLTVSNGNVNVGTLPTSAGATGTLYSVAGVVHVS